MCEAIGEVDDEPQTLRSAEALLHTDVMITLYSIERTPLYSNPAARNAMPDEATQFKLQFCDERDFEEMQSEWLSKDVCRRVALMKIVNASRWFELTVKRSLDAVSGEQALLVTSVDDSELKTVRDQARYLADRDQLTGCFNRAFITQRLEMMSEELVQTGKSCAVLFLDIDNFKTVNDRFGHEVGDMLLCAFATRVQSKIRTTDIIARMGGDEFVVLVEDVRDMQALYDRLEAIQTEVVKPLDCGTIRLNITASIGVSVINSDSAHEWSEIIKQADIALYSAKRSGRNRHTVFNEALGAEVSERNWLEAELKTAIDAKGFGLHYQPRFPLSCLKLDKSFVQKLPASGPLLRLILTLAKQIGATTVAEGVETEEQLEWLARQGCDQVQGFLFSRAIPEAEFLTQIPAIEKKAAKLLGYTK